MTAIKTEPVDISVENGEKFVVDKRLLNSLIKNTKNVDFKEMKSLVTYLVQESMNKTDLIDSLDKFLFTHKVVNHPNFPAE